MSNWEEVQNQYPTKHQLTQAEKDHLYTNFKDSFAAYNQGKHFLFAWWSTKVLWSQGPGLPWNDFEDNKVIHESILKYAYTCVNDVEQLNVRKRTGSYRGKEIKWNPVSFNWVYLNNRTVHFDNSTVSDTPEDDDTARVEDLLQRTETTISSAIQKLASQSHPSTPAQQLSRPGTPAQQTSMLHRSTVFASAQQPSQVPTPPVSKGKQRTPTPPPDNPGPSGNSSSQTLGPNPAPLPAAPPPLGGNPPPNPPAVMAQQNQSPHPIGTPPKAFDGSADKATPFWNSLKSYYSINADVFTNEGKHVAAALTHFKLGTQAGDWASNCMATALAANPVDYGTWADFETAFKAQFIPPQTQNEAIAKLYNTPMGSRSFNEWYQDWSMHARRSGVDDNSKIYAFRRMLNS